MPDDRKRYYVSPRMQEIMDERRCTSRPESTILNMIADRYAELCRREIPTDISESELMLLRDSLNGTILWDNASSVAHLWHGIEDSIKLDGLAEKWNVDGAALVEKLKSYTYAQELALTDFIERYWAEIENA